MSQETLAKELATKSRARRVFTAEDVAQINAGIGILEANGADEVLVRMLRTLAPVWHTDDAEALALAKKQNIEDFGGIQEFKDFIEGDFRKALEPYAGLVKLMPICNNIASFYARRKSAGKVTYKTVSIDGTHYKVNAEYHASLEGQDRETVREALLSHQDTKKIEVEVVEL